MNRHLHLLRTAALSLQDQAVMEPDLTEAARVAHILATAAEAEDVPAPRVRSWLYTADLDTPRALLVRHGTPDSYALAHALTPHPGLHEALDRIGDALTDVELDHGDDGSYDYFEDPRPQWLVRITWPRGAVDHDAVKAWDRAGALQRARWNWPAAARVFVSYDHGHDEMLAEAEQGDMWDYTPDPEDLWG